MLFAVPSSAVNSAMDYFTKLLGLAFRERLTRYFHEKYLQKMFYTQLLSAICLPFANQSCLRWVRQEVPRFNDNTIGAFLAFVDFFVIGHMFKGSTN